MNSQRLFIFTCITVYTVGQFVSVDQPQWRGSKKKKKNGDWNLCRSFSSGAAVARLAGIPYFSPQIRASQQNIFFFSSVGNYLKITTVSWEPGLLSLDRPGAENNWAQPTWWAASDRGTHTHTHRSVESVWENTPTWSCTAVTALLTLHLHTLCINCKKIIWRTKSENVVHWRPWSCRGRSR